MFAIILFVGKIYLLHTMHQENKPQQEHVVAGAPQQPGLSRPVRHHVHHISHGACYYTGVFLVRIIYSRCVYGCTWVEGGKCTTNERQNCLAHKKMSLTICGFSPKMNSIMHWVSCSPSGSGMVTSLRVWGHNSVPRRKFERSTKLCVDSNFLLRHVLFSEIVSNNQGVKIWLRVGNPKSGPTGPHIPNIRTHHKTLNLET